VPQVLPEDRQADAAPRKVDPGLTQEGNQVGQAKASLSNIKARPTSIEIGTAKLAHQKI
jgi:hypothetical protein